MFSVEQKWRISAAVEKVLLDINHPEMSNERPRFSLHVDGKESRSWADIATNWTFNDNNLPSVNLHNEAVAEQMNKEAG